MSKKENSPGVESLPYFFFQTFPSFCVSDFCTETTGSGTSQVFDRDGRSRNTRGLEVRGTDNITIVGKTRQDYLLHGRVVYPQCKEYPLGGDPVQTFVEWHDKCQPFWEGLPDVMTVLLL